jgi:hypothetical protein
VRGGRFFNPRVNVRNGYIAVGWLLFLQEQIKVIIISSARRRSIISQRWSPFCAIVVRQQVFVKLFEGLKGRAVPSVGICKILTSNPFGGMRE